MIYSLATFFLLITRNYLNKEQRYICNALILQVIYLCLYDNGYGAYGIVILILFLGELTRRLEFGNHDGNRKY